MAQTHYGAHLGHSRWVMSGIGLTIAAVLRVGALTLLPGEEDKKDDRGFGGAPCEAWLPDRSALITAE